MNVEIFAHFFLSRDLASQVGVFRMLTKFDDKIKSVVFCFCVYFIIFVKAGFHIYIQVLLLLKHDGCDN